MTVVRFEATPVEELLGLLADLDGLQREVHLASLDGDVDVGADVVEGIVVHRDALEQVRTAMHAQAVAARAGGRSRVDLVVDYPVGAEGAVRATIDASRGADRAAAEGRLLGPPLSPDRRHLQEWMYEQVLGQLAGGRPTPYTAPG